MAITTEQEDEAIHEFSRQLYTLLKQTANLSTDDIRSAVVAQVSFIESNAVPINNAFPEPFKSTASNQEKRYALALASMKLAGL